MEMSNRLANYVRARRKRAGLSQRELALMLGYENEGAVSRHELFHTVPPLLMALAYEVIFQTPISQLFAGLQQAVESAVESRLAEFEIELSKRQRESKNSRSTRVLRKLEWLRERRVPSR
jgi:transcriptional regulator with XRE-family HTH domain